MIAVPADQTASQAPGQVRAGATSSVALWDDELMTGEGVGLDVRPAGFILRAAGAAIDWVLYVAVFLGIVVAVTFFGRGLDDALTRAIVVAALVFSFVLVPLTIEVASHGRSLGKLVIGARIVRDDGGAAQFRHAFVRSLTAVLEILMTFGGLAVLVALLSPRSKRLGDILAGTYAQHERVTRTPPAIRPLPPQLAGWARVADVARIPDPLARRIAQFLADAEGLTPATRYSLAAQLAAETAPYIAPPPPADPETTLAAAAAVRRERDRAALTAEQARLDRLRPLLAGLPHGFPER